jgi:hypothetical protein
MSMDHGPMLGACDVPSTMGEYPTPSKFLADDIETIEAGEFLQTFMPSPIAPALPPPEAHSEMPCTPG